MLTKLVWKRTRNRVNAQSKSSKQSSKQMACSKYGVFQYPQEYSGKHCDDFVESTRPLGPEWAYRSAEWGPHDFRIQQRTTKCFSCTLGFASFVSLRRSGEARQTITWRLEQIAPVRIYLSIKYPVSAKDCTVRMGCAEMEVKMTLMQKSKA